MNVALLVLLLVLWALILGPGALRGVQGRSPTASVDAFERSMGILASDRSAFARTPGRHVMVVHDPRAVVAPRSSRRRTLERRRLILQWLAAAVVATAILGVAAGGVALAAFWVSAAALVGYVGLLLHLRSRAEHTRRTVRRLPVAPQSDREIVLDDVVGGR
jgi:hypothetical protein